MWRGQAAISDLRGCLLLLAVSKQQRFRGTAHYPAPFCSRPLAAAASKPLFQLLGLGLGPYLIAVGVGYLSTVDFVANAVRFRAFQRRGGGGNISVVEAAVGAWDGGIESLGLLRDGCRITERVPVAADVSGGAVFFFRSLVSANGYYFSTVAGGPAAADPVAWAVDASVDNGTTWTEVGASGWRVSYHATPV